MGGNNAINVNPPIGVDEHITSHGSSFYFAICAIMGASAIAVFATMFKKQYHERYFHYISIALLTTASIAYFTMGSNLGYTPVNNEFIRSGSKVRGVNRQVFYARYIDWVVTTPLLLMDILLTASLPWSTILFTVFMDLVMIITGLIGALVTTRYKFGYFTVGCVAMFVVFYEIVWVGRRNAAILGSDLSKLYTQVSILTLVVWTAYPIIWGVAEGGNIISSDSEAVAYGVLDFVAKPVFTALLLFGHRNIDITRLRLGVKTPMQLSKEGSVAGHHESVNTTTTA